MIIKLGVEHSVTCTNRRIPIPFSRWLTNPFYSHHLIDKSYYYTCRSTQYQLYSLHLPHLCCNWQCHLTDSEKDRLLQYTYMYLQHSQLNRFNNCCSSPSLTFEFFLNNTNLTFLAFLYKIDITGLQKQQK